MKFIYLFSFIFIFHKLYCIEQTGVKFAISEKMAYDVLYHFYPDINNKIKQMELEDIHVERGVNIREIKLGIPNFTQNKVKIKFKEKGINIDISGLKGFFSCTLYINKIISFHNNINIDISEFNLNANILLKTKNVNGKLIPDAQFIGTPSHTINFDVDIDGFMFGLNGLVESKAKKIIKEKINDFIKDKSNDFLKLGLSKIPTELPIDLSKGYYIDYSLVDNIKMKNGYLEVNSYAFLYNKNKPETQLRNRFNLNLVPSISTIDSPNQLYISEYSINSALFTFFTSNPLSKKFSPNQISTSILKILLPGMNQKYGDKNIEVYLETTKPGNIELLESYINGKIFGRIILKIEGENDSIFECSIEISTRVEIFVMKKKTISGKILSLSIKVGTISKNKISEGFLLENVNCLIPPILSVLNDFIKNNIKFTLPIFFKNVYIQHQKNYLLINYSLKKEIYYSVFTDFISRFQKIIKDLYFKNDISSYKTAASLINREIDNMYRLFFTNYNLNNQYNKIKNIISKIPDTFNDSNKRKNVMSELDSEISKIKNIAQIEQFSLNNIGLHISNFIDLNLRMSDYPANFLKAAESRLKSALTDYYVRFICPIETTLLNHINEDDNYFIMGSIYLQCHK